MRNPPVIGETAPQRPPMLTVRPRRSWLPASPRELWLFRGLFLRLGVRDLTLRYRQTALGVVWVVLQPLLAAGVLSFVFGTVAGLEGPAGIPYFIFSLTGMVAWTAFSQMLTRASGSLVAAIGMVQKVYFPRLLLPLSTLLSTLVDVGVSLVLLGALLAVTAIWAGLPILTLPLWLALLIATGLGLGMLATALMVRYRDVQYVLPVATQLLLFATPVAYLVPAGAGLTTLVLDLNPLTGMFEGVRWALLGTAAPSTWLAAYSFVAGLVALGVGLLVFTRMEREFADVI